MIEAHKPVSSRSSPPWPIALGGAALEVVILVVLSLVLLEPALINGYPILFFDSAAYVDAAAGLGWHLRSLPYSLLIRTLSGGGSAWTTLIGQAVIIAIAILVAARSALGPTTRRRRLATLSSIVVALAFSTEPQCASILMPDAFTLVGALGLFAILRSPSRWSIATGFFLLALPVSVHASHPIVFGIPAMVWLVTRRFARVGLALGAVALGVLIVISTNWASMGRIYYDNNGPTFLFGRMIGDDLIRPALLRTCPKTHNAFCNHIDELRGLTIDDYVWHGPRVVVSREIGDPVPAERELIWTSFAELPWENIEAVARHCVEGIWLTAADFSMSVSDTANFKPELLRLFPKDAAPFDHSRQVNHRWNDPGPSFLLDLPCWSTLPAALFVLLVVALGWRTRSRALLELSALSGVVIGTNIVVIATVSASDYSRYFSRLNGLIFINAALFGAELVSQCARRWITSNQLASRSAESIVRGSSPVETASTGER